MSIIFVPDPDDVHARFLVELDSLVCGVFRTARGLNSEREILEIPEGGRAFAVARLGPYAAGHIVLEGGESDEPPLYRWFLQSKDEKIYVSSRRNGHIIYLAGDGAERFRWRFKNARVTEWDGPFDPPEPGLPYAIARLGISHEGLEPITSR